MLRSYSLSHKRRANVWLGQTPAANFDASSVARRIVKPPLVTVAPQRIAAIEINYPHGPRSSYALLGAELVASEASGLEIAVAVNAVGLPFNPSLSSTPDAVRVGLPEEYAGAVIAGVESMSATLAMPANVSLQFRWAAHDLVNSSPSIFEKASGLIVRLLLLPDDISNDQLVALFEERTE